MTARKKKTSSTRKPKAKARAKAKGKAKAGAKSALGRIEDELPANLRDYAKQVQKRLNALERDLERAIPKGRRRIAKLIREASHNLGVLEERGEKAWRQRAESMTKDAQKMLRRLEKAVAPPARKPAGKKKAAKKKAAKKPTTRRAAASG